LIDQYCWIQADAGRPEAALRALDDFLLDKGQLRSGFPRLLLARCRLHRAMGRVTESEKDLEAFFHADNLKLAHDDDYADACMIRGFALADRGDEAGARRMWRDGYLTAPHVATALPGLPPTAPCYLSSLASDGWIMNRLLAGGLADELSEPAAIELLQEGTVRSQARAFWQAVDRLVPLPQTLLRDMVRTKRGRWCARRAALRALSYGEYLRLPRTLMLHELLQRSLFPKGIAPDQDEIVWKLLNDLSTAHMNGQLSNRQLSELALAWKGASGPLGWEAVEKSLDVAMRGPCAYLLGIRYLQLNRREDALRLFAAARAAGPVDSPLRRLAEAEGR